MVNEEAIIRGILTGAERWKAVKARQYELKLPLGVYTSDLPLCVLLAELPGTEDQIIERIEQAAAMLVRLRADGRVSGALGMSSDATAILALASIPDIDGAVPAVGPAIAEVLPVAAPEPQAEVPSHMELVPTAVLTGACDHVGSDGKCSDCTGDRTVECAHCVATIVVSAGTACKSDEDDCGKVFCADCADGRINEHGYCEDCETLTCDGCNEGMDRGTEKKCSRTLCESKYDYCADCAGRMLNAEGLCPSCSEEDTNDCQECNNTFTESRLTRCAEGECGSGFCADCKGTALSAWGFCSDCDTVNCDGCQESLDNGTEKRCAGDGCANGYWYCTECSEALLNVHGLCANCGDDEEDGECDGCDDTFISSRLTACANDDCAKDFCVKCAPDNLEGGLCSDCR